MAKFGSGIVILIAALVFISIITFLPTPVHAQAVCPALSDALAAGIGTTTEQTLESDGVTRNYRLHLPSGYDPAQPTPLIFSLHGFASDARQQELFSRWDEVADENNLIVVYPQGLSFPARWNATVTRRGLNDGDVQFISDIITALQSDLCIDPARIYVNGLSNGGGMSYRLACEMADTFAAIGTVAGAYSTATDDACQPSRPVPVIAFHGDADPVVDYNGTSGRRDTPFDLPPIQEWVQEWAERNGCDLTPETLPDQGEVSGIQYTGCAGDADVVFYTIAGGGHTWPGGNPIPFVGKTTQDINASATMWEFFAAHPLP